MIEKYSKLKDYLLIKRLEDFSEFVLGFIFICAIWLQLNETIAYKIPVVDLKSKSNIEIIGFIVAILSMYGVYIGFLQYLTSDEKSNFYLGLNKLNYLLEKSFWYYVTQSKTFLFLLFSTILIPLLVKLGAIGYYRELSIVWQTSYFLLLVIYIFLLKMSLYIIRVALLIKAKYDENLKLNMRKEIQKDYSEMFDLIWSNRGRWKSVGDYIGNKLSRDFRRLSVDEYQEFVNTVFNIEYFNANNLYYLLHHRINGGFQLSRSRKLINWFTVKFDLNGNEPSQGKYKNKNYKDLSKEWSDFYKFIEIFLKAKWEILKKYKEFLSAESWFSLIEQDIILHDKIVKDDSTKTVLNILYPNNENRRVPYSNKKIREFLFETLLDKKDIAIENIMKKLGEKLYDFSIKSNNDQLTKYKEDYLEYGFNSLFKKYEDGEVELKLPKFQELSGNNVFVNNQRNDYENSMLYSEICFNYLDRGRIQNFTQAIITEEDNDEQKKQKIKPQRIQNLILSMNEEYRLAYMLFQLLYTDHTQWDDNLEFYDTEIKQIMRNNEQYDDYLFAEAKKILLKTNINRRITESFLDMLWDTRKDIVSDWSWFNQFGRQHEQSDLKIFYIQWLLSAKEYSYPNNRFRLEKTFPIKIQNKLIEKIKSKTERKISVESLIWGLKRRQERIEKFCREYFVLTNRIKGIFTKESYSYEQNNLQISVEYLLHNYKVNLSGVIENLPITSLLRLEWILRWRYYHYEEASSYTYKTFFDAMASNSPYYWSGGEGIVEFYIVKIIDGFYTELYVDGNFLKGLKNHLESQLNSNNKTVEEYVESICQKLPENEKLSVLQKGLIISKLNDILFSHNK